MKRVNLKRRSLEKLGTEGPSFKRTESVATSVACVARPTSFSQRKSSRFRGRRFLATVGDCLHGNTRSPNFGATNFVPIVPAINATFVACGRKAGNHPHLAAPIETRRLRDLRVSVSFAHCADEPYGGQSLAAAVRPRRHSDRKPGQGFVNLLLSSRPPWPATAAEINCLLLPIFYSSSVSQTMLSRWRGCAVFHSCIE